ncbi:VOC family protein [Luteimonas sp. BDR2-5]|uniref:VOC family protein n=1 Tax=Proluteimonas luteida TaxID=2878685 RepID=UPI001E30FCE7|nr:VOC family protein [Luteimonas sp. BDR2-5]MCD9029157.1 VOC family protein [Luteimonas sp. BDR2-5]
MTGNYDPGPRIAHAGGINIGTPDLKRSLEFFNGLFGMEITYEEDGVAYLRGYQEFDHHSLVLTQQSEATINAYSFRVARPQDVELFHRQLTEEGLEVKVLPAGTEAGRGEAIRFLIPGGGHPVELYYEIDKPKAPDDLRSRLLGNSSRRRALGVRRLDHLNVMTSMATVNDAEAWLQKSLGFKRREFLTLPQAPGQILASWLSVNSKLHDIAIGASPNGQDAQFHHVAFSIENFADMLTAADQIKDMDIQIDAGPGKHGIGQAMYLYLRDPGSGHRIELYSGGREFFEPDWEPLEWKADNPAGMTWYGDLPDIDPATSAYVTTTPSAGLELPSRR